MKTKWTKNQENFLKENFSKLGALKCSKILDKTYVAVQTKANRLFLKRDREDIDSDSFLKFNSPESVYFFGLWWADGSIKTNRISLEMVKEDLLEILSILESFGPLDKKSRKRFNYKEQLTLSFCSVNISNMFNKFIYPHEVFEIIPEDLKKYWYMGYLDGDGNINIRTKDVCVTFASFYDQDWSFIQNLCESLNIKCTCKKIISKHGHKSSHAKIYNKQALILLDYIYKDCKFIGLSRKYNKYLLVKDKFNHITP